MKNTDKTEIFESTPMPTAAVIVLTKMFRRLQNERGVQNG